MLWYFSHFCAFVVQSNHDSAAKWSVKINNRCDCGIRGFRLYIFSFILISWHNSISNIGKEKY
jgi:hypothetical protein